MYSDFGAGRHLHRGWSPRGSQIHGPEFRARFNKRAFSNVPEAIPSSIIMHPAATFMGLTQLRTPPMRQRGLIELIRTG
jgi:glucokinase